jgi:arginase
MLLIDGANTIAGDLPRSTTVRIDVPLEAGESLETGVLRASALQRVRALLAETLEGGTDHAVVIGGDCGVAVPAIEHALAQHPTLAVVWCDAHGDLNVPETSPSGAFGGMALRAVLGEGEPSLRGGAAIEASRAVLVGVRDLDHGEEEYVESAGIRVVYAEDLVAADSLAEAVAATGAEAVYVHIDLDVLDPAEITGVNMAAPFGARTVELAAAIRALRERVPLVGASIAGFAPSSEDSAVDDMGAILRLVGAVA